MSFLVDQEASEVRSPFGTQSYSPEPMGNRSEIGLTGEPKPFPLYAAKDIGPPGKCMYCLKVDEHITGLCPFLKRVPKNEKISEGCDVVCIVCNSFFRGSCCGLDEGRAIRKNCRRCGQRFDHWSKECPQLRKSGKEDQNPLPEPRCNRLVSQTERPVPYSNHLGLKIRIRGAKRRVSKPAPAATSSVTNSPDFHPPTDPASKTEGPEAAPAPFNSIP